MEAWEKGLNPEKNSTNPSNWDFSNSSSFFAGTVLITIGEVILQSQASPSRPIKSPEICIWWTEYTCKTILTTLGYSFLLVSNYTCYITPAKKKKKLSAYLVCAITFCNAHLEVALKRSVVLTTKSENYRK